MMVALNNAERYYVGVRSGHRVAVVSMAILEHYGPLDGLPWKSAAMRHLGPPPTLGELQRSTPRRSGCGVNAASTTRR